MDSQRPTTVDEEVAALSRSADRDSLFLQAGLILPGSAVPVTVRVRNLSPGGMLAEAKIQVAQGAAIEVDLRNIGPVPGRVAADRCTRRGGSAARLLRDGGLIPRVSRILRRLLHRPEPIGIVPGLDGRLRPRWVGRNPPGPRLTGPI